MKRIVFISFSKMQISSSHKGILRHRIDMFRALKTEKTIALICFQIPIFHFSQENIIQRMFIKSFLVSLFTINRAFTCIHIGLHTFLQYGYLSWCYGKITSSFTVPSCFSKNFEISLRYWKTSRGSSPSPASDPISAAAWFTRLDFVFSLIFL